MENRETRTVLRSIRTLFSVGTAAALSDGELIERFVRRSDDAAEVAFAALVERHGPMVLRISVSVLHDTHAAEDAFQATFLILARKAGSIRKHESVASWLFGVARRVAGRAKGERAKRAAYERRGTAIAENHAQGMHPSVLVPEVHEEVDRLPAKYRAPIVLCYFEGLTHEEAAGHLRVPVGTVKVRLARARKTLRARLTRRGLAPGLLAAALSRKTLGAVAAPVVDSTIKAAMRIAAGRAAGVSAPVAALVEGVLRAMFLTRLKATAALLAAGMTLVLASVFVVFAFPRPVRSDQPPAGLAPRNGTAKVAVETVKRTEMQRTTDQVAWVYAFTSVDLAPKVSGYLKGLKVDIGDAVKSGQVLAEIDAPELAAEMEKSKALVAQAEARVQTANTGVTVAEASLDVEKSKVETAVAAQLQAESALRVRRKELEYTNRLAADKVVSRDERSLFEEHVAAAEAVLSEAKAKVATARGGIEEGKAKLQAAVAGVIGAKADVGVARAELRKAAIQLDSTRIAAPFDGIVTQRGFQSGDFIRSGGEGSSVPVLRIMKTEKMRVVVEVPDRDVPLLDKGDRVTVRLDALGDRVFPGIIARTAYAEDPQSRTLRAEIDLDNADGQLRPGQFGSARIVLEDLGNRLTIPMSALIERSAGGNAACYRIEGMRVVRTRIKTGKDDGVRIEVVDGLKEGDSVVSRPETGISDGQAVEPEPMERAGKKGR